MRKWRLLSALFIVLGPSIMLGQDDPPVIRGTINVILANANGIVALTDSQQTVVTTAGLRPYPDPGQKLFRLDDRTVCTIAGFASAPLPTLPQFASSAAGTIQEYVRAASGRQNMPFVFKLRTMAGLFEFFLEAVASVRDVAPESGQYHFELIMAGYDVDGTPKLGRLTLGVTVRAGPTGYMAFSPVTERLEERTVGRELAYEVGGQPAVSLSILRNPEQFSDDPAIRAFARAYASDRGASLSLEQMKRLAIALARHTAANNPTVGGADQIAVLQDGKIANFEQQLFREQASSVNAMILNSSTIVGDAIAFDDPKPLILFFNNRLVRVHQSLDGAFFSGNEFANSQLRYDGGWTRFDSKNRVTDSVLIIGARAARGSETVRHLADDFAWKQVIFERP